MIPLRPWLEQSDFPPYTSRVDIGKCPWTMLLKKRLPSWLEVDCGSSKSCHLGYVTPQQPLRGWWSKFSSDYPHPLLWYIWMILWYLDVPSPTRLIIYVKCLRVWGRPSSSFPLKKTLFKREVKFLGHTVSGGVAPDPGKVEAVARWPRPTTPEEIKRFLRLCSYCRRFCTLICWNCTPSASVGHS